MTEPELDVVQVPTYTTMIYVGLKCGYDGEIISFEDVEKKIQEYVDWLGMCVTVTRTKFIYTDGNEPGIIVGFINYPRYPSNDEIITRNTITLAQLLLKFCHQRGVTVVTPTTTYWLRNPGEVKKYRPEDAN